MKIYLLESLHSMRLAKEVHRPGSRNTEFNISQSQRRNIFIKCIFMEDLPSINNCLQSVPLLFKLKGQAALLLRSPKLYFNLPPEAL